MGLFENEDTECFKMVTQKAKWNSTLEGDKEKKGR